MLWSSCREVQKISGGKCVPISYMKKMFQEENTNKGSQNCWNYSFSPGTHFDFTSGKTKPSWLFFPCRWHKSISVWVWSCPSNHLNDQDLYLHLLWNSILFLFPLNHLIFTVKYQVILEYFFLLIPSLTSSIVSFHQLMSVTFYLLYYLDSCNEILTVLDVSRFFIFKLQCKDIFSKA